MKVGQQVWWKDPDQDSLSGWYKLIEIRGEIYVLKSPAGSIVDAFIHELHHDEQSMEE